jgi:hypothetical protein
MNNYDHTKFTRECLNDKIIGVQYVESHVSNAALLYLKGTES